MSQWYAIRVETRREREAHDALTEKGFAVFMPMEAVMRKIARELVIIERPLFDGYVFALVGDGDFRDEASDFGIVRNAHRTIRGFVCLNTPMGPLPMRVPVKAIIGLQAEERAGVYDRTAKKPNAYRPKEGAKVQITAGPWYGYMATVLNTPRGLRAKVRIQLPAGVTKGQDVDVKYLRAA